MGPVVWKTAAENVPQVCLGSGWRSRIGPMCRAQAVPHQRSRAGGGTTCNFRWNVGAVGVPSAFRKPYRGELRTVGRRDFTVSR